MNTTFNQYFHVPLCSNTSGASVSIPSILRPKSTDIEAREHAICTSPQKTAITRLQSPFSRFLKIRPVWLISWSIRCFAAAGDFQCAIHFFS